VLTTPPPTEERVVPSEPTGANPFVTTASDPFATFAADVDTASYDIFRRSLANGYLPHPKEVRSEEFVNYFRYAYPAPAADAEVPFTISLSAASHLAGGPTKLLRVGIQGATYPKRPMNVVFLVDVSGSMAAENKLPLVQRVLRESLDVLDPESTVAIVTYAGATAVALPATSVRERTRIASAIQTLESSGGTNGGSGIILAYEQAQAKFVEGGINHVVLCTDGDFNLGLTSNEALVALIEQKRQTGVTLTALGFGERNNDAMMERVSNAGNGIYSVLYNEDQAIAYTHQRLLSSMIHIAKDVKLQLELNPLHVYAYRLIGYEDRWIADGQFRDDRVDAGEIGSGHQVTALFELALEQGSLPANARPSAGQPSDLARTVQGDELVRVSVRYKRPGAAEAEAARELSAGLSIAQLESELGRVDGDALWAMGVATLAERVRGNPYAQALDVSQLHALLAPLSTASAERAELVRLLPDLTRLLPR
jgi:Ca-activated chloride channel family protein